MAKWSQTSGVTVYRPTIPLYLHERTRFWHVRLERAAAVNPITAKVYANAGDAAAGNGNYSGTGTVAVALDRLLTIPLTSGPQAPPLAGAVLYLEIPAPTALGSATGTAVWKVDLGKKIRRAQLWALRAFSKITTANGYFTDFVRIERGFRTYEDAAKAKLVPYLGCDAVRILSSDRVMGGAQAGSLRTEIIMRCVAYEEHAQGPNDVYDSDVDFILHDLRRAVRALYQETWAGTVDDGVPVASYEFSGGEPDLGMEWAREKAMLTFELTLVLDEAGLTEVATP